MHTVPGDRRRCRCERQVMTEFPSKLLLVLAGDCDAAAACRHALTLTPHRTWAAPITVAIQGDIRTHCRVGMLSDIRDIFDEEEGGMYKTFFHDTFL